MMENGCIPVLKMEQLRFGILGTLLRFSGSFQNREEEALLVFSVAPIIEDLGKNVGM